MVLPVKNIICFHCFKVKTQVYTVFQQKLFNWSCIPRLAGAEAGFAAGGNQTCFTELDAVLLVESRWATGPKNSYALESTCWLCSHLIFAYQLQRLFRSAASLMLCHSSSLLLPVVFSSLAPLHPDSNLFHFLSTKHLLGERYEQLGLFRQLPGLILALEPRSFTGARW